MSSKRKASSTSVGSVKKVKRNNNAKLFPFLSALQDDNSFDFKQLKRECIHGDIKDEGFRTKINDLAKKFKFLEPGKHFKSSDFESICQMVDHGIRFSYGLAKASSKRGTKAIDSKFDETVSNMVKEASKKELNKIKKVKDCDTLTNQDEVILCKLHKGQNKSVDKLVKEQAQKFTEQFATLQQYAKKNETPSEKELNKFKETTLKLQDLTAKKFHLKNKDFDRIGQDLKKVQRLDKKLIEKKQEIIQASKSKKFNWNILGTIASGFSKIASFIGNAIRTVWNSGAIGQISLVAAVATCFLLPQTYSTIDPGWFSTSVIQINSTPCAFFAQQFFATLMAISKSASWSLFWTQLVPILTIGTTFLARLI